MSNVNRTILQVGGSYYANATMDTNARRRRVITMELVLLKPQPSSDLH